MKQSIKLAVNQAAADSESTGKSFFINVLNRHFHEAGFIDEDKSDVVNALDRKNPGWMKTLEASGKLSEFIDHIGAPGGAVARALSFFAPPEEEKKITQPKKLSRRDDLRENITDKTRRAKPTTSYTVLGYK